MSSRRKRLSYGRRRPAANSRERRLRARDDGGKRCQRFGNVSSSRASRSSPKKSARRPSVTSPPGATGVTVDIAPVASPYFPADVGSDNKLDPGESAIVRIQFPNLSVRFNARVLAGNARQTRVLGQTLDASGVAVRRWCRIADSLQRATWPQKSDGALAHMLWHRDHFRPSPIS